MSKRMLFGSLVAAMLIAVGVICMLLASWSHEIEDFSPAGRPPRIFPDYAGIVMPPNIAPLNFSIHEGFSPNTYHFEKFIFRFPLYFCGIIFHHYFYNMRSTDNFASCEGINFFESYIILKFISQTFTYSFLLLNSPFYLIFN